jgi:hypothetical protein
MIRSSSWAAIAALSLITSTSGVAEDAGRGFDCDAPAGRAARVSQPVTLPAVISGVLLPVKIRRGSYVPQAGAGFESADGKNAVGFAALHGANSSRDLDLVAFGFADSSLARDFEKVSRFEPIPFSVSLSRGGQAVVKLGRQTARFDAKPMDSGKVTLFCRTGQFKFTELNIPISNQPDS